MNHDIMQKMAHQNVSLSNSNLSLERGFKNGKIKSLLKLPCSENLELASNFFLNDIVVCKTGRHSWCGHFSCNLRDYLNYEAFLVILTNALRCRDTV